MGTVVFDFDSTLVRCESLEVILAPLLAGREDVLAEIAAITNLGMEGRITFRESLERRLQLAAPTRAGVLEFAREPGHWLTEGCAELVADLLSAGTTVRIVSGGLREAIVPFAAALRIPADHVHAVQLQWHPDGRFAGIDPNDSFSESKLAGVRQVAGNWVTPRVGVGDGMTDYHLFRDGFVDHFLLYTGHVRRAAVAATGVPEVATIAELRRALQRLNLLG